MHADSSEELSEDVSTGLFIFFFNFFGITIHDAVLVPGSWFELIQDKEILPLLFNVYATTTPPISSKAMETILQLISIRRGAFSSEEEVEIFMNTAFKHFISILNQGLIVSLKTIFI